MNMGKRPGYTREVKEMNFEQWLKEMSKGSTFSTEEDNTALLDRISEVNHRDVENEEKPQKFKLEMS
jgi:hypothetical protein